MLHLPIFDKTAPELREILRAKHVLLHPSQKSLAVP
jgi:hypothetical protein